MVQLPGLFQGAGWVVNTFAFLAVAVWTCCSSLYLSRTIAAFPGNSKFAQRWEFGRVASALFPRWAYVGATLCLCVSFIATNISNIILSSQVVDDVLLATAKKTCALQLYPAVTGVCVEADNDAIVSDSPFGTNAYVISIGYLIIMVTTIPLSRLALDDNIIVQIVGMAVLTACVLLWTVNFLVMGFSAGSLPAFASSASGGAQSYASVLPTCLFNYGFVTAVPSWLNEKSPRTPVTRTLVASVVLATFLYLLLGFFGAASINFSSGSDLLSLLADGSLPGVWGVSKVATYIFPVANLVTSIPVFSLLVRYNAVNLGWRVWAANLLGIGVPWLLSIFFYAGNQLNDLINWSSALFFVMLNLILPLALYLATRVDAGHAQTGAADDSLAPAPGVASKTVSAAGSVLQLRKLSSSAAVPLLKDIHSASAGDAEGAVRAPAAAGVPVPAAIAAAVVVASSAAPHTSATSLNAAAAQAASFAVESAAEAPTDAPAVDADDAASEAEAELLDDSIPAEDIHALPGWWMRACCSERNSAVILLGISVVLAVAAFGLQVYSQATPSGSSGGSR